MAYQMHGDSNSQAAENPSRIRWFRSDLLIVSSGSAGRFRLGGVRVAVWRGGRLVSQLTRDKVVDEWLVEAELAVRAARDASASCAGWRRRKGG